MQIKNGVIWENTYNTVLYGMSSIILGDIGPVIVKFKVSSYINSKCNLIFIILKLCVTFLYKFQVIYHITYDLYHDIYLACLIGQIKLFYT